MQMIKLNNGAEVTLDEFITWGAHKQGALLKNPLDFEKIQKAKYAKGTVYRSVITPKGEFKTASEAADAEGVSVSVLTKRLQHLLHPEYHYVDEKPEDIKYTKPIRKRMQSPAAYNAARAELLGKCTRTPLGEFETLGKAAKAHEVSMPTIKRRMRDFPSEYYFVTEGKVEAKPVVKNRRRAWGKQIQTPNGQFSSVSEAAVSHGVSTVTISNRRKKFPNQYFLIKN